MRHFLTVVIVLSLAACSGGEVAETTSTDPAPGGPEGGVVVNTPPPDEPDETEPPRRPDGEPGRGGHTVVVDGAAYTCEEMIDHDGLECNEGWETAFTLWGDNLDAYVNSPDLGPLADEMSYKEIATQGLGACIVSGRNETETEYIEWSLEYIDAESVAFLPFWFRAHEVVCPDQELPPTRTPTGDGDTDGDWTPSCENDERCYASEEMLDLYNRMISFVEPFFTQAYIDPPRAPQYLYVASGIEAEMTCEPGISTAMSMHYCSADEAITLGQDAMWETYAEIAGDAGVALSLAHEWGHHLQHVMGVPSPQTDRETIPYENQADCIAGAWVGWANDQGHFSDGDAEEMLATLNFVADVERIERSHGIDRERREAVAIGLVGGLEACNDFFSRTPLIHFDDDPPPAALNPRS